MQNSIRHRHQRRKRAYLYCSGATVFISWLNAGSVLAQQSGAPPASSPPANPQPAPAPSVSTVTVVAPTPGYKTTIDGRSYSIANDLQKSFGTLAGVLGHLPSVQVDPEGNISLRGDPNVTILVDGKPSPLFSGPGRTQALQSISPDQFDRVEIMTNPSAGQTAEGSGGVINLISKPKPKGKTAPTATGTIKADVGSGDRYEFGATAAYSAQGLSLSGGANYSQSGFNRGIETRYQVPDPSTGALVPADGVQLQNDRLDVLTLYGSAGYDIDPRDHLDVGLNLLTVRNPESQNSTYQSSALSGPLALAYVAPGVLNLHLTEVDESLDLTHTFPDSGHSLSFKLSLSQGSLTTENVATYDDQTPVQPALYQSQVLNAAYPNLDLKIDYKTPLPNKAKLTLGYEGKLDWQSEDNAGVTGVSPASAATDSAFAQSFIFNQQVQAIYATYEQTFGELTVQPGLRLETTTFQTDLVSSNQKGSQAYFEAYPSLHLNDDLDDASQFHASYGRRIHRPDELQLDPFRTESSETLYTAGNPNLRPELTQSYELGYEFRKKTTDLQANLFYRDKSDVLSTTTQDIGADVLLQTTENIGHAHDAGLELSASRDLTKTLSLNASTDLMNSDVNASNLGILTTRSAFIASGKATLNWQVSKRDYVQLSGQDTGKQLTAQGYRGGAIWSDLGWRHRFNGGLAAVLTAQDPFGLARRTLVIDTPTLIDVQQRKFRDTAVFAGLTYAFGGPSKRAANNFDFGAKAPGDR
jgi:outer membrane receptor protein involved in Fe transport